MSDKQIFAALEAADHEIRLVVGEFFNTRFNIIKVERIPSGGVTYDQVVDPDEVTRAIRTAVANTKKMLGADVKSVIMAMPSYHMKKYSYKSTVDVEGIDGTVTVQDVRNAIRKAQQMQIAKDYALIQTVCVRYTVNGISTRRVPLGERCSQLTVDIDLLCADRKFAFDLVTCAENAGLSVMDLFLDVYAVGKEAALFEQAVDRQVVILKVEREGTTLGLLKRGRLTTAAVLPAGLGTIAGALSDQYGIRTDIAAELLKYSCRLDQEKCSDNPVHIWSDNGETRTISEQELVDCVRPNVAAWANAVQKTCGPILQADETTVIITGEGGETDGLDRVLQKLLGVETRYYIPETLGGRNGGLTACLGLFYAYQDRLPITGNMDDSLDMDAFIKAVSYRDKKNDVNREDTLTNKLKGLFLEGKKN
ncbi:MAG: cell division protein FtsA [Erysipelotrichaceae bacterium]|nr:cell division protein FtsA [Erysipelotrichaceae bacterium]